MSREEFWEWLATCPSHKYESIDDSGYVTVTFKVQEETEDESVSQ
jgi:hypothetical protein|tara:strand:- start:221 stop:355 length:135 start_codon:yes stop_codon:yes gene_type:complete